MPAAPPPADVAGTSRRRAVPGPPRSGSWDRSPARAASRPVLHAGPQAVYLDLDGTCVGRARCATPSGALRRAHRRSPSCRRLAAGDEVTVFNGTVELPGSDVLVTTIVDATVPGARRPRRHVGRRADRRPRAAAALAGTRAALPDLALERLAAGDTTSVPALLGLGSGLTPLGDDVLCGWLAAAVARRHPALGEMHAVVEAGAANAPRRCPRPCSPAPAGVRASPSSASCSAPSPTTTAAVVDEAVDRVLQVGETSGGGLLLGAVLALGGGHDRRDHVAAPTSRCAAPTPTRSHSSRSAGRSPRSPACAPPRSRWRRRSTSRCSPAWASTCRRPRPTTWSWR